MRSLVAQTCAPQGAIRSLHLVLSMPRWATPRTPLFSASFCVNRTLQRMALFCVDEVMLQLFPLHVVSHSVSSLPWCLCRHPHLSGALCVDERGVVARLHRIARCIQQGQPTQCLFGQKLGLRTTNSQNFVGTPPRLTRHTCFTQHALHGGGTKSRLHCSPRFQVT